jgi:hypothetical protein
MLGFEKKKKFHTPSSHQAPSQYVKLAAHIPINVLPPGVTCGVIITHFGSTFQVEKLTRQCFSMQNKDTGQSSPKGQASCLFGSHFGEISKYQCPSCGMAETALHAFGPRAAPGCVRIHVVC